MQRGGAVQQHWMVLNDLFQDVPDDGILLLNHLFCLLDGGAVSGLLQPVINKWLEKFERHFLGKTALVQLQLGSNHDYRAAGIINALSQQVLAESPLLAFQRVRERLEWTIVGPAQYPSPTTVIKQRVHSFLQHALFIAHDDFRSMEVHQLL